jgi:hypothetical protein
MPKLWHCFFYNFFFHSKKSNLIFVRKETKLSNGKKFFRICLKSKTTTLRQKSCISCKVTASASFIGSGQSSFSRSINKQSKPKFNFEFKDYSITLSFVLTSPKHIQTNICTYTSYKIWTNFEPAFV